MWSFPDSSVGKESACNAETPVWSLSWEDPLEKGKATHASTLAWRISWKASRGHLCSRVAGPPAVLGPVSWSLACGLRGQEPKVALSPTAELAWTAFALLEVLYGRSLPPQPSALDSPEAVEPKSVASLSSNLGSCFSVHYSLSMSLSLSGIFQWLNI